MTHSITISLRILNTVYQKVIKVQVIMKFIQKLNTHLLMPQRVDRAEFRCFSGWIDAKKDTDE